MIQVASCRIQVTSKRETEKKIKDKSKKIKVDKPEPQ